MDIRYSITWHVGSLSYDKKHSDKVPLGEEVPIIREQLSAIGPTLDCYTAYLIVFFSFLLQKQCQIRKGGNPALPLRAIAHYMGSITSSATCYLHNAG